MLPPLSGGAILRQRYKITNIVGRGGMGSIYRAEDLRLPGRLCAIKEVQPDPNATPGLQEQAQAQFFQEASTLARLDHPNLPKVSDFFHQDGRDYLVMDFVAGKDLRQILKEEVEAGTALPPQQVLVWAEQMLDALIYLHEHEPPVVHRDIKPANIKLTPNNRIKLVDFGLVKLMDQDDARTITVVQGRGTAFYTPLEQYGGNSGHTDRRSDIYALGATLYHLLTGEPPPSAKARFLHPGRLRPPHKVVPTVDKSLSGTIMWAMEMHPDDRPRDLRQFRRALTGGEGPPQEREDSRRPSIREAVRVNWLPFLAALLLFLLAVALTVS